MRGFFRGGGGMCGFSWGVYGFRQGGHAWLLPGGGMRGFFAWGGMRGFFWGGHAWFLRGGACVGYDEIRSMSGRYASYWNAFLFFSTDTYDCQYWPFLSFHIFAASFFIDVSKCEIKWHWIIFFASFIGLFHL